MTDKKNQLEALAAFAPRLAHSPLGSWQPTAGDGSADDPYRLPWFSLSELGKEFIVVAYQTGWILEEFDWAAWAHGSEGQLMANDRTALANADADQLAKLLTVLVRQDRFSEGALSLAFDTGLLLAIANRAQALCAHNSEFRP